MTRLMTPGWMNILNSMVLPASSLKSGSSAKTMHKAMTRAMRAMITDSERNWLMIWLR